MRLVVWTGREEQGIGRTGHETIAKLDAPQAIDHDGTVRGIPQRPDEMPGIQVICIDAAVAKIANQQVIAELAKVRRRQGQAPGGVELAARGQPLQEDALRRENVDKSKSRTGDIVFFVCILL